MSAAVAPVIASAAPQALIAPGISSSSSSAPATLLTRPAVIAALPKDVTLSERDVCDLEMYSIGAFDPLKGYMSFADFCSVVLRSRLTNGTVWPMPFVVPVKIVPGKELEAACNAASSSSAGISSIPTSPATADSTQQSAAAVPAGPKKLAEDSSSSSPEQQQRTVNLRDVFGTVLGVVTVEDVYRPNLDVVCQEVLGTMDGNHPYVTYLRGAHANCVYVGGSIRLVHPVNHFDFRENRINAAECRKRISEKKWETVVGFQSRNPMHRSHFELTAHCLKEAAETTKKPAHLLLTPACGPTQPGDIPAHIRVRCYKKLVPYYASLGHEDAMLVLLPLAMRMAGPREAIWHALIRKNFGCTHFIVGRDHAGPSTRRSTDGKPFYGPYEAHEALEKIKGEIGIVPIFGKNILYLGEEHGYVQEDKVPAGMEGKSISGTMFRSMLINREPVPEWYSFKPVVEELYRLHGRRTEQGICIYFTGLPCSGKSTLAEATQASIHERESEIRKVTLLDADIIRTHLSKGLGFSKEDRSANVQRIGFVAGTVVKHGGICLVANIAPYESDRKVNRQLVESNGGAYIEVYVSTPLDVCETRDVKGFFKLARQGSLPNFTGISDPYEIPKTPELTINSSQNVYACVDQVIDYLETEGYFQKKKVD